MKTLLASAAACALLSGSALAQSEGLEPIDPQSAPQSVEQPAVAPIDEATSAPAPGFAEVTFIAEQGAEENLASEWIGETVYGPQDENIGDINDLLFATDGSIEGVVLGVGGFLGIGEKVVAVPIELVQTNTHPDSGETFLYLPVTAEQLENAPDFTTLADIRALEEVQRMERNQGLGAEPGVAPDAMQ